MQATQNKELSNVRLLIYFIVSLMFNCLGNALTVALNLGSALWTAAAVNISDVTPVSLSMIVVHLWRLDHYYERDLIK